MNLLTGTTLRLRCCNRGHKQTDKKKTSFNRILTGVYNGIHLFMSELQICLWASFKYVHYIITEIIQQRIANFDTRSHVAAMFEV